MDSQSRPQSPIAMATNIMLDAMQKLLHKEISADEASAIALNGRTIVEAAREATSFAKVTGFLPVDAAFGSSFREIEPQVSKEALVAQAKRIRLDSGDADILPPARQLKKRDPWDNKGEYL